MSRWRNPDEIDEDDTVEAPDWSDDSLLDDDDESAPFYEDPDELERLIDEELGAPQPYRRRRL